jgi:hypothetical protein
MNTLERRRSSDTLGSTSRLEDVMAKKGGNSKQVEEITLFGRAVCGTCSHWERLSDARQPRDTDVVGECLKEPPIVIDLDDEGNPVQVNPMQFFRSRCGQHQPQEH